MTLKEEASIIAKAIHDHGEMLEQSLELLDDTLTKGFAEIEEQLENIGDALRELEPDSSKKYRGRANSK
jgi:hypothetical protein